MGATQLVVQLAQEMIDACLTGGALTRWTTVGTSSVFAGEDKMTYLAPALMCFSNSTFVLNAPVHSNTTSIPNLPHGSFSGSISENTRHVVPSTTNRSVNARTFLRDLP